MADASDKTLEQDERLRYARAAAWARGQSLGPWGQGIDEQECRRIEELRDELLREETAAIPFQSHTHEGEFFPMTQHLDYSAIIDDELARLGEPLPVEIAELGFRGLDLRARQVLHEKELDRFTDAQYRSALRQVIRELLDNRDQLTSGSVVGMRLHEGAKALLRLVLIAQGRDPDQYTTQDICSLPTRSTVSRTPSQVEPESDWATRRLRQDALAKFAMATLEAEGDEITAASYRAEFERLEAEVAESMRAASAKEEKLSLEERVDRLERRLSSPGWPSSVS